MEFKIDIDTDEIFAQVAVDVAKKVITRRFGEIFSQELDKIINEEAKELLNDEFRPKIQELLAKTYFANEPQIFTFVEEEFMSRILLKKSRWR